MIGSGTIQPQDFRHGANGCRRRRGCLRLDLRGGFRRTRVSHRHLRGANWGRHHFRRGRPPFGIRTMPGLPARQSPGHWKPIGRCSISRAMHAAAFRSSSCGSFRAPGKLRFRNGRCRWVRADSASEIPAAFASGFALNVPLMDTTIYLDYLARRFGEAGGEIHSNTKLRQTGRSRSAGSISSSIAPASARGRWCPTPILNRIAARSRSCRKSISLARSFATILPSCTPSRGPRIASSAARTT